MSVQTGAERTSAPLSDCLCGWTIVHMLVWVPQNTVCHKGYNKSSGTRGLIIQRWSSQLSLLRLTLSPTETSVHCCITSPSEGEPVSPFLCFSRKKKNNPVKYDSLGWSYHAYLRAQCSSAGFTAEDVFFAQQEINSQFSASFVATGKLLQSLEILFNNQAWKAVDNRPLWDVVEEGKISCNWNIIHITCT